MSRIFHPNFSAKWRRYLYIFPINEEEYLEGNEEIDDTGRTLEQDTACKRVWNSYAKDNGTSASNDDDEWEEEEQEVSGNKPRCFSINRVNQPLKHFEGKGLSYRMFARDTKAS